MKLSFRRNPSGRTLLAALAACAVVIAAARGEPPQAGDNGLLVLKTGQVLAGKLDRAGDRYLVLLPDGELRIRAADVEFVCHTLDEVYVYKRSRLMTDRPDEHLDLADWCLRQGMLGHAAEELSTAIQLDPHHPRIALTERRLDEGRNGAKRAEAKASAATKPSAGESGGKPQDPAAQNEELDRLVRGLPAGVMESFTTTIQPVLLNSCTTSGCHGPRGNSSFQLERLPLERNLNPRLTQRNMQAVLAQLNLQEPAKSRLLTVPEKPHGTVKTPFFSGRQAGMYHLLSDWVELVAQGDKAPAAGHLLPPHAAMLQTLDAYGFHTGEDDAAGSDPTTPDPSHVSRGLTGRLIAERKAADKAEKAARDADKNNAGTAKPGKKSASKNNSFPQAIEALSPE